MIIISTGDKVIIKEMAELEKPRERLINYGKENLSNEELIAIVLRTGTKNVSSKILATKILGKFKSISELKNANIINLSNIKGMGKIKSIELIAAIELGRRVYQTMPNVLKRYENVHKIYDEFKYLFSDEKQEKFYALYFDTKQNLIEYKLLFQGTLNVTTVHPREIFKEAFLLNTASFIIIHNHPSGDVLPSKPDLEFTRQIDTISKIMGINFLDHIIFGQEKYYSFYEENRNK